MNKIQIKRSKGFIGGQITGAIISFSFLSLIIFIMIINFHPAFIFLALIFLGCLLLCLYFIIQMLSRPKIILEYDEFALYYNLKKEQIIIKYCEIIGIKPVNERNKWGELSCGWIYITKTDSTKYKIGVINDVKKVYLNIKEYINK